MPREVVPAKVPDDQQDVEVFLLDIRHAITGTLEALSEPEA